MSNLESRIDGLPEEVKDRIRKSFEAYRSSDDELISHCIIFAGMEEGTKHLRNMVNNMTAGVDAAKRVASMISHQAHQISSIHFVLAEENVPEFASLDDEVTISYRHIASLISSYAYGTEYSRFERVDEYEERIKKLEDELLDAQNGLTVLVKFGRDMRDCQKGFFDSPQGSRERQEFLSRSKACEKSFDAQIKLYSQAPKPPDLFT